MVTFVTVNGTLNSDPAFKDVTKKDGTQVEICQLSIKSQNYVAGKKHFNHFNVTIWPGRADNLVKKLNKGSAILITGQLYLYSFTTANGDEDSRMNINMHSIQFPVMNEIGIKKRKLTNGPEIMDDNAFDLNMEPDSGIAKESDDSENK